MLSSDIQENRAKIEELSSSVKEKDERISSLLLEITEFIPSDLKDL